MEFTRLSQYLNANSLFVTATKKLIRYKRVSSYTDTGKLTFYIHTGEPVTITTYIDGDKETSNTCKAGDYVISGPKGEKYVVMAHKLPANYNLIEDVLITRLLPRNVAKITKQILKKVGIKGPIEFIASWGESMVLGAGDYLVKEDEGKYYRIDGDLFKKTYKLQ
jgi:hypothetical protein